MVDTALVSDVRAAVERLAAAEVNAFKANLAKDQAKYDVELLYNKISNLEKGK